MKKIILLLVVLLLKFTSYCQTAYNDAVKLRSMMTKVEINPAKHDSAIYFDGSKINDVYSVMKNYTYDPATKTTSATDKKIYNNFCGAARSNDFICKYFQAAPASPLNIFSSLASSAGNLDVTALADGLAKFLVERTKEELNEAFFRKFADFINHYPEFRTLFPYTNTLVNNFNSWEYSNLLNTFREAFDKDIKELLTNFIKLKDLTAADCHLPESDGDTSCTKSWCSDCRSRLEALHKFFSKTNEGLFLLSAARIGNGLLQNEKFPDILDAITQPDFLLGYTNAGNAALESDLKNSLELANIFSMSLRSEETGRSYITEEQFKMLGTDPVLQDIYFGLIYQQVANANSGAGITISGVVVADQLKPANIQGLKNYIGNVFDQSKNFQKSIEKVLSDKLDGKEDVGADYALVFEASQKLLSGISSVNIISSGLKFPKELTKAFTDASKGLQIAHDISVRNYNAAVIGALKFISDAVQPYIATQPQLQEFAQAFLKYGSFASNVVLSKNSDEIKESIKSFVLPSGSSSLKKHTAFSITLNAYVGFVYGATKNSTYTTKSSAGTDSAVKLNGGKTIGIYAPVGLGFNFGWGWKNKNPASVSVFVSLIDIGAVVGYRFVSDTGDISQKFKISLANIFAPGGNLIIGLPNMPLSIGGGLQWIPSLQRDPKSNSFYNIDHSGFRWQLFLAVDLPLLNFHSSKKNLLYVKSGK